MKVKLASMSDYLTIDEVAARLKLARWVAANMNLKRLPERAQPYAVEIVRGRPTMEYFEMYRPMILVGCWPRRMCAELAATYCGEPSANAFLKRVGTDYPHPRVNDGRRRLWLRDDLDQAILPRELATPRDLAEDL
jgi:hypothetical protein